MGIKLGYLIPILLLNSIFLNPLCCTGFTIWKQNTTVPMGWVFPGKNNNHQQLFDPSVNTTVIATPIELSNYSWLERFGIKQPETVITDIPISSGVTDNRGFIELQMYDLIKYNLTIKRENGSDTNLIIYPTDNYYVIYLGG